MGDTPARRADSRYAIEAAIPHRPPFLFLDRILEESDSAIAATFTVRGDADFFKGHYPGHPIMPGVLLMECVFQAGAVLLARRLKAEGVDLEDSVPVVTRAQHVRFLRPVRPGEELRVEAELLERKSGVFFMRGRVARGAEKVASLDFACTLIPMTP